MKEEFLYASYRSKGDAPQKAYEKTKSLSPNWNKRPIEVEASAEVAYWRSLFRLAESPDDVKRELSVLCLDDSRNEELSMACRQKSRDQLIRLYGFDKQEVSMSTDDVFRNFLMARDEKFLADGGGLL